MQGRNRAVENGLVDTVGERESGTNGESSINIYTLSTLEQIAGRKLVCNTGNPAWHFGMTSRGGMREARPNREGTHV